MAPPDGSGLSRQTGTRVTLHLGVVDQPYRSKGKTSAMTTYGVAKILEAKYGLMQRYYDVRQKQIIGALEWGIVGAVGALVQGKRIDPYGSAAQKIQSGFRDFIASKESERVGIPGTPTKAALAGINHRLAHPYRKANPRRPSFLDTGLLISSFRAWVD